MTAITPPDVANLFSVKGKNVLITGAASGIGLMMATTFVAAGARVWITGRNVEALAETQAALAGLGPVETLAGDLATVEGVQAVVAGFQAQADKLHVLVNNAGQTWGASLERFPDKAWEPINALNVRAPFMLTQRLLPQLVAAASDEDPARIINIGSVYAEATDVLYAYSYAASKAAIHQLTRVLASELAPKRILVNAIAPGLFPSKMTAFALKNEVMRDKLLEKIPLGRAGTMEDVGAVALLLSSRAGAYMTGNIIPLDGGILASH